MLSSSFIYLLILPVCVQGADLLTRSSIVVTADTSPVDVLDTAQSAKGLFAPRSRLKRDPEHIKPTHLPCHVPLHRRQLETQIDIYIARESPYFLPSPQSPGPFTNVAGNFPGDPDFKDCDGSNPHCAAPWGLMIVVSTNVHILSAGLYNWFQEYTQPYVDSQDCQQRVVFVKASGNIWVYNLCDSSKNCQKGQRDFTVNCPTSWAANTDIYADIPYQLTYVLTNEAKFFSEISEKYGIQKDWIEFGDHRSRIANCCHYAGADVNKCDKKKSIWWHGWPLLKDINIPNPKDVFSDSCDKVSGRGDLVNALALPSLMMSEAVESMRSVVKVAKKALEEERKSVIANFLTAILMLIPIAGEAAAEVGARTMRAIIGIAGELANVGVTIYAGG
ncbi:putative exo-1,3-beta-D-glucanase [Colletotrichum sublineola]|uniref:Putative exo-1,3-beta-D-glucanase n=1 Tax=Colletotrichum sublineola TaxID=1173701 RepID=A0A066XVD2_COLSU|nr:putative exo-1,3-beta-D-glucanase [Colletotrichum sublineola]